MKKDKQGLYASHVIIQIACPKYPESKDRVPKSFLFIPSACCVHLSSCINTIFVSFSQEIVVHSHMASYYVSLDYCVTTVSP